jgi:guanylate kinase
MNLEKILSAAKKDKYYIISKEELEKLLSDSELIIEKDTHISDKIRLLKLDNDLIIQEKTTKDELLIRIVKTKKEGEDLIKQRLEIYDKMWDGCGCKVDYYE